MTAESLTTKFAYRIEPKPEGGFVARSSDPSMPTFEGATAEEVKQQIQAKLLEAIGLAGAPGLTDVQYWISQATGLDIVEPPEPERPIPVIK